jgi:hypothetical protein
LAINTFLWESEFAHRIPQSAPKFAVFVDANERLEPMDRRSLLESRSARDLAF